MVGIIENAVPSYTVEIAPTSLRGVFGGSLQCMVTLGAMWGSGMGRAVADYTSSAGWIIAVAMQFIPAVSLLATTPFTIGRLSSCDRNLTTYSTPLPACTESPRWLVSHRRKEQALKNMNRI